MRSLPEHGPWHGVIYCRRKVYTDNRQLAIRAQKLRKASALTRFFARFERKPERPFTWEYKEDTT